LEGLEKIRDVRKSVILVQKVWAIKVH
jgi:hypothetical protein